MRILVTFAVEQEFTPWRKLRAFVRARATSPSIYETQIGSVQVRVVLTGMGAVHARRTFPIAAAEGADLCISSGLAGGLRPRHRVGDVLVARAVLDPSGVVFVKSDGRLANVAAECGARVVESFRSCDYVVATTVEKGQLALTSDAVEMESFAILSEAQALGIPAVAVRVIGDTFDQDLPLDFGRTVGARGQVSVARVLAQLARKPLAVPALARLGQQARQAGFKLAAFLDRYVEALATGAKSSSKWAQAVAG